MGKSAGSEASGLGMGSRLWERDGSELRDGMVVMVDGLGELVGTGGVHPTSPAMTTAAGPNTRILTAHPSPVREGSS